MLPRTMPKTKWDGPDEMRMPPMPATLEAAHAEIEDLIRRFFRDRVVWLKKHDKLEADNLSLRGTIKKLNADLLEARKRIAHLEGLDPYAERR